MPGEKNGSSLRGRHGAIWTDVINPYEVIPYVRMVVSLKDMSKVSSPLAVNHP